MAGGQVNFTHFYIVVIRYLSKDTVYNETLYKNVSDVPASTVSYYVLSSSRIPDPVTGEYIEQASFRLQATKTVGTGKSATYNYNNSKWFLDEDLTEPADEALASVQNDLTVYTGPSIYINYNIRDDGYGGGYIYSKQYGYGEPVEYEWTDPDTGETINKWMRQEYFGYLRNPDEPYYQDYSEQYYTYDPSKKETYVQL